VLELLEVNYLLFTNQTQKAENKFNSYEITDITQPLVYLRLGSQIALAQQKYHIAITYLSELVKLESNKKYVLMLAIAHSAVFDIDAAISVLTTFLYQENDIEVRMNLAQIYMINHLDLAKEQYIMLVDKYPQSLLINNNLALAAATTNDIKLAEKHITKAFEMAPENSDILDTYGFVEFKRENFAVALKYYLKASKIAPEDNDIKLHLVECFIKLNRLTEAKALLAEVEKTGKFSSEEFNRLVNLLES
jgi:tetratricopeptide (TPR) repeat protein